MYTIKEASARSGVGIPLLRAWERRYGVVSPARTASGYRLYGDDAITRLIAMRRLIDAGWAAQQAAGRIRDATSGELAELAAGEERTMLDAAAATAASAGAHESLVGRIAVAARELDVASLEAALDETFASLRFEAAWESVLRPALREIGHAWERGEVTVAGEHATSHAVYRRLAMAFDAAGPAPTEPPILVGLAPEAQHEYGALAFATAARRRGLPILYLGADLPVDAWVTAAAERHARAVVIGVPRSADVRRATDVVSAVAGESPSTRVLLGGANAGRVRADAAVVLSGDTLDVLVEQLNRELAPRRPG